MDRLIKIGFINVGKWQLSPANELNLNLLMHYETRNLIYSFIVSGEIKYIGKTTRMLHQRMGFYKKPGIRQSTNIRINKKLKEVLQFEEVVDIFILPDNGLLHYGDYHINLAAGIEDSLITSISPAWNLRGASRLEMAVEEILNDEPEGEDSPDDEGNNLVNELGNGNIIHTVVLLGDTYYNNGFFNLSKEIDSRIAGDRNSMEILLGYSGEKSFGYINRTANKSGAPRIFGGVKVRNWIQTNFKLGDSMNVEILSPQCIRLLLPE